VNLRLVSESPKVSSRTKEGAADGVVAFGISNPAMILIKTDDLFHTPSKESSQNEEVTRYSNCVLENGSLHWRLRF
jgi:hypothetical protein